MNPETVVAVLIDAADNSMMAAEFFEEKCFLGGLLRMQLPEGVCLIITTRTERTHLLPLEREMCIIDLPAFELCESTAHLCSVFRNTSKQQCEEFHQLTGGNPRLQSYLLSGSETIADVLAQGKLSGKTVDSLFKKFIIINKECLLNLLKATNQALVFYITVDFKDNDFNVHGTSRKPAKLKKLLLLTLNKKDTFKWEDYLLPNNW